jgi:hypothetical protein
LNVIVLGPADADPPLVLAADAEFDTVPQVEPDVG